MNNDLISRSELKQKMAIYFDTSPYFDHIIDVIDSAPAVTPEITVEQAVAKIQETDLLSKHDKILKEWADLKCVYCNKNVRPQGKWIYDDLFNNWKCSICGECPKTIGYVGDHDFMKEHFKFCNHCGADMRGGAE